MAGEKVFPWQPTDIRKTYQLGPCLGKGHLGHVRLVEHLETGKFNVCKTILKERLQQKESNLAELMSEINGIRLVGGHPNIVELTGQFEDEEAVHLVMDLCAGGDLFDFIADRRRLSEEESAFIIRQLASALRHCHSRGLIHRDIKPENILLCGRIKSKDGTFLPIVKLADFGMSIKLASGEKTSGVAGSLTYMAPEMVKQEEYNREIDIWSLGVVLYIALSGYVPFPGSTREDVFEATCEKEPNFEMEPWHTSSPDSMDLVQWMLKKDPQERPTATQVLNHPWVRRYTQGLKVVPSPPPLEIAPRGGGKSGNKWAQNGERKGEKEVKSGELKGEKEGEKEGEGGEKEGKNGVLTCDKCGGPVGVNGTGGGKDGESQGISPATSKKLPPLHPSFGRRKNSPREEDSPGSSTILSPEGEDEGEIREEGEGEGEGRRGRHGGGDGGERGGRSSRILPFSPRFPLVSPRFGGEKSPGSKLHLLTCTQPMTEEGEEKGHSEGENEGKFKGKLGSGIGVKGGGRRGIGRHSAGESIGEGGLFSPSLSCMAPTVEDDWGGSEKSEGPEKREKWTMSRILRGFSGELERERNGGFEGLRPQRRPGFRSPLLSCTRPQVMEHQSKNLGGKRGIEVEEEEEEEGNGGGGMAAFRNVLSFGGGQRGSCIPRRDTSHENEEDFVVFRS